MGLPSSLLSGLSFFLFTTLTTAQKDNANRCECFRTNGSEHFYSNHIFRDFRNIGGNSGDVPAIITDAAASASALATSNYFLSDEWKDIWATQSWNNSEVMTQNSASILMVNSPNNVYIGMSSSPSISNQHADPSTEDSKDANSAYKTYLTLRTHRTEDFQSAAEIDTREGNFQYISLRLLARVTGSPGACAGIFTYLANDDPEKVQEADIEILTSGPRNMVQYTNQPSDSDSGHPISKATRNSTNPGERDWTLWNTYRYDWTPETSAWYVNGESVANISFQVPRDPTQVILNMWSDGGMWTGNMSTFDQAFMQIQWMQMVFNTSGPFAGDTRKRGVDLREREEEKKGCALVCSVDDGVTQIGTPAFLYNDTKSGVSRIFGGEGMGGWAWVPMVVAAWAFALGL